MKRLCLIDQSITEYYKILIIYIYIYLYIYIYTGNCAVRDTDYGTWFIQDFKKVFQEYGTQKEYQHLLTVVNKLVSKREVPEDIVRRLGLKGSKQMPCFLSKFTKQLYLTSNLKGF